MSKQINLTVDQGTTFSHIFDVLNPDGTPFDLTGFTAYSQMKKSYFTSTFHNLTVSVEGAATDGKLKLTILPSTTDPLRAGLYVYDIEIHSDADPELINRVAEGTITLSPQVTRIL